jgi:hypothetical protein
MELHKYLKYPKCNRMCKLYYQKVSLKLVLIFFLFALLHLNFKLKFIKRIKKNIETYSRSNAIIFTFVYILFPNILSILIYYILAYDYIQNYRGGHFPKRKLLNLLTIADYINRLFMRCEGREYFTTLTSAMRAQCVAVRLGAIYRKTFVGWCTKPLRVVVRAARLEPNPKSLANRDNDVLHNIFIREGCTRQHINHHQSLSIRAQHGFNVFNNVTHVQAHPLYGTAG